MVLPINSNFSAGFLTISLVNILGIPKGAAKIKMDAKALATLKVPYSSGPKYLATKGTTMISINIRIDFSLKIQAVFLEYFLKLSDKVN